ncbi:MAG: glycosyltransferase family 4 protein [Candidatus Krumholzibacteria bacterium]|nr:glycosyltransferase family 4 protein [Candidatus Krumholzibacteria bacterium]
MRVLVFTNMYPCADAPFYGSFVSDEVGALRARGVEADVYFVNGRADKLAYLAMPAGFAARMRRARYDVVHVHHSFCGLVATMQRRVPVVWTFHEGEISRGGAAAARGDRPVKRLAYSRRLKRFVARRADAVIVVAAHLAAPLGRADAIHLPSGIDTTGFAPMDAAEAKRRLGFDPARRYVLFPSTPARPEKRFDLARAAVDAYRAAAGGAGDDVALVCLEDVPHEDVPLYMNASELLLMTSAFEASPVTIREALSCNVPVVSTDVGDAKIVLDGIEGCYIVEPDPARIAEALGRALAGARRVASRERMAAFSLEQTAGRLVEIYREIMERRQR